MENDWKPEIKRSKKHLTRKLRGQKNIETLENDWKPEIKRPKKH
jgi:hypothetical protein